MHTLQSHLEFMLINLKGLWAITFRFPGLLDFPLSSKSVRLSLLLQTSHTSSPCHSLLMTYFLGQGAKRACTTACPAASNLPSLPRPAVTVPVSGQQPGSSLPSSRTAPTPWSKILHPLSCVIGFPFSSQFFPYWEQVSGTQVTFSFCPCLLLPFTVVSCVDNRRVVHQCLPWFFFPVLFETVRFQETSLTTVTRSAPPRCKTQWPILSPRFLCLSASFNWPFLSFSLKHFFWLSRTLCAFLWLFSCLTDHPFLVSSADCSSFLWPLNTKVLS